MPFLTKLQCEFVEGTNEVRLTGVLRYYSERIKEYICVDVGFVCDAASTPRIFWSATGLYPFDYRIRKSAILHDYLYRMRGDLTRKVCDKIFYDCLKEDGYMDDALMLLCYRAVRIGGGFARELMPLPKPEPCE